MLHTLRTDQATTGRAVLRAMFEARKSVFVDLLKWDVPVLAGRFELDQFDDAHATYLVLTDRQGGHRASARLLPTMRPHILGDLFPQLCAGPPPRAPDLFEITRFCLDRGLSAHDRRQARDTLVVALVEYALAHGIVGYTAIAEIGWFQQILAFGWRSAPLGLPQLHQGSMLAALRIEIDADTPHRLAAAGIRTWASQDTVGDRAAA